jgi:hypothetical protein
LQELRISLLLRASITKIAEMITVLTHPKQRESENTDIAFIFLCNELQYAAGK